MNHQLRTVALRPQPFVYPQANREVIVEELSEKRGALLRERNAYPQNVSFDLAETLLKQFVGSADLIRQ